MISSHRRGCLLVLILLLLPAHSSAQGIPGLRDIDAADFYVTRGAFVGGSTIRGGNGGPRGIGFELLYDLGTVDNAVLGLDEYEVALGYEYQTGFTPKEQSLDLRGAVQTLPALTFYASNTTHKNGSPKMIGWYVGLGAGLVQLQNARAYDAVGNQYSVDGTTYQMSVGLGLMISREWFIEGSYALKDFRSLDWKFGGSGTRLPPNWPRTMNLSSVSLAIGYEVRKHKPATPSAPKPARFNP